MNNKNKEKLKNNLLKAFKLLQDPKNQKSILEA